MANTHDNGPSKEQAANPAGTEEFNEPSATTSGGQAPVGDSESEDAEVESFGSPDEAAGEAAEQASAEPAETQDIAPELLEMRDAVERTLAQQVESAASSEGCTFAEDVEGAGNVQGVGIADAEGDFGLEPGVPALTLYVAEPMSVEQAKAVLVDSMGVAAASSDDVPVNVVVTGVIDAFTHRFRIRPAPGGVSIGHCRVTAGTLGCLARGRRGTSRYNRLLLLSNNHVIANSNNARYGDWIVQPGRHDGGTCSTTRDRIAILERFVRIDFRGRANYVDCATGWCWPNLVRRELVYRSGGSLRLFRISSRVAGCRRGQWVGKSGRTTQLTRGYVTDCSATIRVNYGSGRIALFRDQMAVRAPSGNFSAGGDSGSCIWTWDRYRYPVGLLFAGGGGTTFANKMSRVVGALGIELYT